MGKAGAVIASLAIFGGLETRIVEKTKLLSFQNSFSPHPHLWSWVLGNDQKNMIVSASVLNEIF